MPWKIINTVLDPSKAMRQRTAARMSTEPLVCGRILRVRESMVISDAQYKANKVELDHLDLQGVIDIEPVGGTKAPAPEKKVEAPAPAAEPASEPAPEPANEPEPEPAEEPAPAPADPQPEATEEAEKPSKRGRRKKGKE